MYLRTHTLSGPTAPVAYTCPAGKVALLKTLHLANTTAAPVAVTVLVEPVTGPTIKLIQDGAIPKGASLNAIDGVVIMLPGDSLKVHTPNSSGEVHALLSLMEMDQ